ncbi:hypothetical protein SCACP_40490 [Sporomusa carbonis]|uniref:DUF6431 domain-containing protein n=1 Tax=Sporomusa carbonis TaxID=3076075 RepID=UPI003A6F5200
MQPVRENVVNSVFFVRSMEQIPCPCCGDHLYVIGSRRRKYLSSQSLPKVLVIRRLKCCHCCRIHHELPDILVPVWNQFASGMGMALWKAGPLFLYPCSNEFGAMWATPPHGWRELSDQLPMALVGCVQKAKAGILGCRCQCISAL